DGVPQAGTAAGRAGAGLAGHLPVPVGVERPACGTGLPGRQTPRADVPDLEHGDFARRGLASADCRRLYLLPAAAACVLRPAAVLRARYAGRLGEGLEARADGLETAHGSVRAGAPHYRALVAGAGSARA